MLRERVDDPLVDFDVDRFAPEDFLPLEERDLFDPDDLRAPDEPERERLDALRSPPADRTIS